MELQSMVRKVVVLGTGGTIAGTAADVTRHTGYQAGALGVDDLLAALPALNGQALEAETVSSIDSCDMGPAVWDILARRAAFHLSRDDVAGVVITHGTDTLEETGWFLHRVVAAARPLVLTAAMRPATAPSADGPQNLLDAVTVARDPQAAGVLAVMAGRVHAACDLRKVHGYRVDAFSSGDASAVALLEDGCLRALRPWPAQPLHAAAGRLGDPAHWPAVDIVTSHAGARGETIDALVAAGARGIVIAGTGNGTVHVRLLEAAGRAQAAGVVVWRASRCLLGGVVGAATDTLPSAGVMTPVQARVELMLDLLAAA